MASLRIWDISQPLSPALPVWPGDSAPSFERRAVYGPGCPVNVAAMRLSTHSGTHGDAPFHYDPEGISIADVDVGTYIGPARVVDLRGCGTLVTAEMVRPALEGHVERLLLRTFDRFPHDRWVEDFAAISADAIASMAACGVVLIGTDAPSLDPQHSRTLDAHQVVRKNDMRILEGLVLDDVPAGDYELIALPLKLTGLDASPVRAILRELAR